MIRKVSIYSYSIKKISQNILSEYCEDILKLINIIPHINDTKEKLFEEKNNLYSKWKTSFGVFSNNNELIGILIAYYRKKDNRHNFDSLYIQRLAVDKNYQKQGIGTQLLLYFLEYSFETDNSLPLISIQTNDETSNQYVIDFYHKIGFKDRCKILYPNKIDILMTIDRNSFEFIF